MKESCAHLIPHRSPAVLVAELLEYSAQSGRVSLLPHKGLGPEQLIEAAAQAVASVTSKQALGDGSGAASIGYLGALRAVTIHRSLAPGGGQVRASRDRDLGPLSQWQVWVEDDQGVCALEGLITVAQSAEQP